MEHRPKYAIFLHKIGHFLAQIRHFRQLYDISKKSKNVITLSK